MFKQMDAEMTARFWAVRAKYAQLAAQAVHSVGEQMRQENRDARIKGAHIIYQAPKHTREEIHAAMAKVEAEWHAKMWQVIDDSFDGYEY